MYRLYRKTGDAYEKIRVSTHNYYYCWVVHFLVLSLLCLLQKLEGRVASDEDLKLADLLRYYERDSQAALVRRILCPTMFFSKFSRTWSLSRKIMNPLVTEGLPLTVDCVVNLHWK